jgi:hypothetical protein
MKRHPNKPTKTPPAKPSGAPLAIAAPIRLGKTVAVFLLLLLSLLLLWKFVLLQPVLVLSRQAIEKSFSLLPCPKSGAAQLITVDPANHDWVIHAALLLLTPREITVQLAGDHEAGVRVQPPNLECFHLCLPIFWALVFPVWPGKQLWRILGIGTLVLAIVAQVSLMLFLAYWLNRYFVVAASVWWQFWLNFAGYCTVSVVPYAAPVVLIIVLHRRLRALVFGGSTA